MGVRFSCGIFLGVFVAVGFGSGIFGLGFVGAGIVARGLWGLDSLVGFFGAFLSPWVLVRALGLALSG